MSGISSPPSFAAALFCLGALATPLLAGSAETTGVQTDPWREVAVSLFQDAHRSFTSRTGPDAELGRALTYLVLQPKTDDNVDRAAAILTELTELPITEEIARAARYYLGRIEHVHRTTPNLGAARTHYRTLIEQVPDGDFFANQARIKLAFIDLYDPQASPAELKARFDELLPVSAKQTAPSARRDLSLLLADVALRFDYGDALALDLLLQADRAGIKRSTEQADVWVRIGELARISGRDDIARDHYQRFLDTFPRDRRRLMVSEKLASLTPAQ